MYAWYTTPKEQRIEAGKKGREFIMEEKVGMSVDNMANRIINDVNATLDNFNKRKRFGLHLA